MMKRYQLLFKGVVQGVGFRYFMQNFAKTYKCTGFVKNLNDGSVLVEIQGELNQIEHVLEEMKSVKHIVITDIKRHPIDDIEKEKAFRITY